MEKIKFRLIKDNKIVGYEIPMEQPNGIFEWEYQINYIPKDGELIGESGWTGTFIKHDIKNQFTGLYDKNEKEIYVGDIVHYKADKYDWKMEIEFDDGGYCGKYNFSRYELCRHAIQSCEIFEVIGNIYENPERRML